MDVQSFDFLCYAAQNNLSMVKDALNKGVNPRINGAQCSEEQKSILDKLESKEYYSMNKTALHIAAAKGYVEMVDFLLKRDKSLIEIVDCFHFTALFSSHHTCVQLLLEYDANIHHKAVCKVTALIHMAMETNALSIKILLEYIQKKEELKAWLQLTLPSPLIAIINEYMPYFHERRKFINYTGGAHIPALGYAIPPEEQQDKIRIQGINDIVKLLIKANSSVHFNYPNRPGLISFKEEALKGRLLYQETRELLEKAYSSEDKALQTRK